MKRIDVIATLNTHLLEDQILKSFQRKGATFFRINGSHVDAEELCQFVTKIRLAVGNTVNILLDLPGNKIRFTGLKESMMIERGETIEVHGDYLNFPQFISELKPGDTLLAADSQHKFTVEKVTGTSVFFHCHTSGELKKGKGLHLTGRHPQLPFFFEKDYQLIEEAKKLNIDYLGLSFVRDASDIAEAQKAIVGTNISLIVKVETAPAVENLDAILAKGEEFLVDRGDLSCDVGIENVEYYQKYILNRAKQAGKKVYFATQFLFSMVENNTPLISEHTGLYDAIASGVDGVQMSEETAIGRYPEKVLDLIQKTIRSVENMQLQKQGKSVFWLTGFSGSGKTTIARAWKDRLERQGQRACLIDGDEFREFWGNEIGHTEADRVKNQRNIIFTAHQALKIFDVVIVASLSPIREMRELARQKLQGFHEVFVNCPIEECARRDPKGLYRKVKEGKLSDFVGFEQKYQPPENPELTIDTGNLPFEKAVELIHDYYLQN